MSRYDAYKLDTPPRYEEPIIVDADPDDLPPIDLDDEPYPGSDDLDDMPGPDALAQAADDGNPLAADEPRCDVCGEPCGHDYQRTEEDVICGGCIDRAKR